MLSLLSFDRAALFDQVLDAPGSLLLTHVSDSVFRRRSDSWAPDYFLEQLIRDRDVLVDDNASVIIMPNVIDPRTSASVWMQSMQDQGTALPTMVRPIVDGERPVLMWSGLDERRALPRQSDPKLSFRLLNTGLSDSSGQGADVALPHHEYKFMTDIRVFRRMSLHANTRQLSQLPMVRKERDGAFSSSIKTIELFFVGRTKLDDVENPIEPAAHCLDSRLFTSDPETCPCIKDYSECVRQFVYFNYQGNDRMFIRDPAIDDGQHRLNQTWSTAGHVSMEYTLSGELRSSHFCLVSGGFHFDMVSGAGAPEALGAEPLRNRALLSCRARKHARIPKFTYIH